MKTYKLKNKVIKFLYDWDRRYYKANRYQNGDPGPSHAEIHLIEKGLNVDNETIDPILSVLRKCGEVEYIEYKDGFWGYGITSKGKTRLSSPYTNHEEKKRRLEINEKRSSIWKNIFYILLAIVGLVAAVKSCWPT